MNKLNTMLWIYSGIWLTALFIFLIYAMLKLNIDLLGYIALSIAPFALLTLKIGRKHLTNLE